MSDLLTCEFNIDTACVELCFADGSMISIVRAGTKQPTVAGSMNQKMGRDLKPGSRQHDQPTAIQFTIISSPSL